MSTLAPQTENRLSNGNGQQPAAPRWPTVNDSSPFANLLDSAKFEHLQRLSSIFAASELVPEQFRGKQANVFVALQMAFRCGVDPFMFLQNCYIVHGRPGVESKLAIALLNASGQIKGRVSFDLTGEGKGRKCIASATDKSTGQVVQQTVTYALAEAEGWTKAKTMKNGGSIPSKWTTMTDLMLQYRAAMFLIRLHYPEVLMGMSTKEELDEQEFLGPKPRQPVRGRVDLDQLTAGVEQPQIETTAPAEESDTDQPADTGERMLPEDLDDLQACCRVAKLGGLELRTYVKEQTGKYDLEDLTPAEGKKFRSFLDKLIDPGETT